MRTYSLLFVFVLIVLIASSESAEEKKKKKSKKNKNIQADAPPKKPRQPIYEDYDYDQNYHDEDFKEENNEDTTEVFRLPDDEVDQSRTVQPEVASILAPFSCLFEGTWYREREEFRMGQDQCSICLCVNGQVKCNDESCPRTTPKPPPTTTTQKPGIRCKSLYFMNIL